MTMAKGLTAVSLALLLCFAGFAAVVYTTRTEDAIAVDNLLAEDFSRAVGTTQEDDDGTVRLTEVARFQWDTALLTAPGTSRERISRELGYPWEGDTPFGRTSLLIFLLGGKVVRFADYRGEGVFSGFKTPIARIPRARSTLRVNNLEITP